MPRTGAAGAIAFAALVLGGSPAWAQREAPARLPRIAVEVSARSDGRFADDEAACPRKGVAACIPPDVVDAYRRLRAAPYVGDVMRLVRIDPAVLEREFADIKRGGRVEVELPRLGEADVRLSGAMIDPAAGDRTAAKRGLRTWQGTATIAGGSDKPVEAHARITWGPGYATGSIDGPGWPVRFRSLGHGYYAIYRVNVAALPPPEPAPGATPYDRSPAPPVRAIRRSSAPPGVEGRLIAVTGDTATPTPVPVTAAQLKRKGDLAPPAPNRAVPEVPEITVAVAFTPEAARAIDPGLAPGAITGTALEAFALNEIAKTNDILRWSGVSAQLRLAADPVTGGPLAQVFPAVAETLAQGETWDDVLGGKLFPADKPGGAKKKSQSLLCQYWGPSRANVLVLIANLGDDAPANPLAAAPPIPMGGSCGMAGKPMGVVTGTSDASFAWVYNDKHWKSWLGSPMDGALGYAVVRRVCAEATTGFAHEIGHLLGADHEGNSAPVELEYQPDPNGPATAFGRGYVGPGQGGAPKRLDLMAYGTDPGDRIYQHRVYSTGLNPVDPAAQLGVPGPWGVKNVVDNAAMMTIMAPYLARHRPACRAAP